MLFSRYYHIQSSLLAGLLPLILYCVVAIAVSRPVLGSGVALGQATESAPRYWAVWWPLQASTRYYDPAFTSYSLYPIELNWTAALSWPSTGFYAILRVGLESLQAFHWLLPIYLSLTAWASYLWLRQQAHSIVIPLLGGGLAAFNPITFGLAAQGDLALLGLFVIPLGLLAWDYFMLRPTWFRLSGVLLAWYSVLVMSIQYWNLLVLLVLPYALVSSRPRWNERLFVEKYLWLALLLLGLLLLHPLPLLLRASYSGEYSAIEVWQGILQVAGWRWAILATLLGLISLWGVQASNAPFAQKRAWVALLGLNLLAFWQVGLAPLSVLADVLAVPQVDLLSQNGVIGWACLLWAVFMSLPALNHSLQRQPRRLQMGWWGVGLLAVAGLSGWNQPLPRQVVPVYQLYETIAEEPEDYVVIDYPFGLDSLARRYTPHAQHGPFFFAQEAGLAQFYAPLHRKKVLGGLALNLVDSEINYYRDHPLLQMLTFQPLSLPLEQAVPAMRDEIQRQRIAYVFLHTERLAPEFQASLVGWLTWINGFCLVSQEGPLQLWQAQWHPNGCPPYQINLGDSAGLEATRAYESEWHLPEVYDGSLIRQMASTSAQLDLWATANLPYQLTIVAASPRPQSVEVILNGVPIGQLNLTPTLQGYPLALARNAIQSNGQLHFQLVQTTSNPSQAAFYQRFTLEALYE
jgi:hypothetical protein